MLSAISVTLMLPFLPTKVLVFISMLFFLSYYQEMNMSALYGFVCVLTTRGCKGGELGAQRFTLERKLQLSVAQLHLSGGIMTSYN